MENARKRLGLYLYDLHEGTPRGLGQAAKDVLGITLLCAAMPLAWLAERLTAVSDQLMGE